jgi:Flp pilus assembly protein TadD
VKIPGAILTLLVSLQTSASDLERAQQLYRSVEYRSAIKLLQGIPQKTGPVYELMGKSHFMLADFKKATEFFEKAAGAEADNSNYYMWLGRAWGRRAETSSPFTAPGYAIKARQNFEKALGLNPKNLEAINDLFEYYLQAPGFLGGGVDKAAALAKRIATLDPVEHYWAEAQIAEKRKEYQRAEQLLRRAAELAPREVGRVIDLAKFLARQGKVHESDAAFQRAAKIAPDSPKLMFERAATYVESRRNLEAARELLKRYLSSPLTPDDPSREDAEKLLRQVSGG